MGSPVAEQIRANFLTAVVHTHTWIHMHRYCDPETGVCEYFEHEHTLTETHPPRVSEFEAWGTLSDRDQDGLSTGYEESTWYRQDAVVQGLPIAIPNNGADVLVLPLERPSWSGVATRAFLDLEVDHATPGDLAVAVGSWDGTAWQDRLAWVPGPYANATIWDAVRIHHTHSYTGCERHFHEDEGVFHCHDVTRWYEEDHYYPGQAVSMGTGGSLGLDVVTATTASASSVTGSIWHVTIELTKTALEAWESDAGFRTVNVSAADLHSRTAWRVLVRDWNPDAGGGTLRSGSLRIEERSDADNDDTDEDGILQDGTERGSALLTFPVAVDTDFDGLTDVFEKDPQPLTLTIDGATVTRTPKTNPLLADTDGDGLSDGEEWAPGRDGVITDPLVGDTDGDGLNDGDEWRLHFTDATWSDSDGDGLSDYAEAITWGTSPTNADSDDDGLTDGQEVTDSRFVTFSFPQITLGGNIGHRQGFMTQNATVTCPGLWNLVGEPDPPPDDYLNFYWLLDPSGCADAKLSSPFLHLNEAIDVSLTFDYRLQGSGSASILVETAEGLEAIEVLDDTAGSWTFSQISLESWKAGLTTILFCGTSDDAAFAWGLDRVRITAKTNPWVDDTDGDGLLDGEEASTWGSNPLTWDSDFDGTADFVDPNFGPDDKPPKIMGLDSDDYRRYLVVTLDEASGVATWDIGVQLYNGEMHFGGTVDELPGKQYRVTFAYSGAATAVDNAWINLEDAYGQESRIWYNLTLDPNGDATTNPNFLQIGEVSTEYPAPYKTLTPSVSVGWAVVAGTRSMIIIGMILVVLFCCTAPNGNQAPSSPTPANVYLDQDANALQEWSTQIGTVSLYEGFSTESGGYLRGVGWNFISALYPSVTLDFIGTILTSGAYVQEGDLWFVDWEGVVSGIATLYHLLIRDGVILWLDTSEIVVDEIGNTVKIGDRNVAEHFAKRHTENPDLYPTLPAYKDEIRRSLQRADEIWHSSSGEGWLYVRWVSGNLGFVTIVKDSGWYATAWFMGRRSIYGWAHTLPPGAKYDMCIYPVPAPR
ncbi:MAG TPA: hypothetical protein VEM77_05570 [Thermoplasmata archaeon]|nr:hypothetical protein [Thermoplasmata archaeon]